MIAWPAQPCCAVAALRLPDTALGATCTGRRRCTPLVSPDWRCDQVTAVCAALHLMEYEKLRRSVFGVKRTAPNIEYHDRQGTRISEIPLRCAQGRVEVRKTLIGGLRRLHCPAGLTIGNWPRISDLSGLLSLRFEFEQT
jgi:hypothetical protein